MDGRHKVSLATCSQEVLIQYAQGCGPVAVEAKRRLLTEHERFINGIIKEVYPYREHDSETWRAEREDAQQGAKLGFLQALERFDPTRRVGLGTFAYDFVRRAVLESVYTEISRQGIGRRLEILLGLLKVVSVAGDKATLLTLMKVILLDGNKNTASRQLPLAKVVSLDVELERDPEFERKNFMYLDPEFALAEERPAREAVRKFVDTLPVKQRDLVRRLYWDGRTQAEIARELGKSPAAVSRMMSRIRIEGGRALAEFRWTLAS